MNNNKPDRLYIRRVYIFFVEQAMARGASKDIRNKREQRKLRSLLPIL
jgi:hypothetical protein